MNKIFLVITIIALIAAGCKKDVSYSPSECMSPELQTRLLQRMVRYSSKLAPEASHETKFDPKFNWYYDKAVAECRLVFCTLDVKDSTYQLLIARQARSITPMEEGIAVKVKFSKRDDDFEVYDEVFRMWKMPADSLNKRGKFLYETMLNGGDLTLYYTRFQKDKFIEFPDQRFSFDRVTRRWKDAELDSIAIN